MEISTLLILLVNNMDTDIPSLRRSERIRMLAGKNTLLSVKKCAKANLRKKAKSCVEREKTEKEYIKYLEDLFGNFNI